MRLAYLVVLAVALMARAALAQPLVELVEPATGSLSYQNVPIDGESAPQRIRARNAGDAAPAIELELDPSYRVVATGGSLEPGSEQFWDVVCAPARTDPPDGLFELAWCGPSCQPGGSVNVALSCGAGLLSAASPDVALPLVHEGEPSRAIIAISNPQPEPVTITALATAPPFSAALESGELPVTLLPGESAGVVVEFAAGAPDGSGLLDVVAGSAIAERVRLSAATIKAIQPVGWNFDSVPLGAVYTLPITVLNSASVTRTITSTSFDAGDYRVSGLVGRSVPPSTTIGGLVTFTAGTLGPQVGTLTVAFDSGVPLVAQVSAAVVEPTFSVTTADAEVDDGWLDFGVRPVTGPAIARTFTITNQTDSARAVLACQGPLPPFELIGACPASIPARGSVEFSVRFSPGQSASLLDTIGVSIEGVGSILVALRARVSEQRFALSTDFIQFADTVRATTAQEVVTITNLSDDPIAVPAAVLGTGFALVSQAAVVVPAGESTPVTVEFRPPAVGEFAGSLEIGAPADPDRISITLAGRAVPPMISADAEVEFGAVAVGSMAEASATVRNLDPALSLSIEEILISGPEFSVETVVDRTLAPGASLDIRLRFTPAAPGPATGQLTIFLEGDTSPEVIIALTGEGVAEEEPREEDDGGCRAAGGGSGRLALVGLALVLFAIRRRRRRGR